MVVNLFRACCYNMKLRMGEKREMPEGPEEKEEDEDEEMAALVSDEFPALKEPKGR